MNQLQKNVGAFMLKAGQTVRTTPSSLEIDEASLRVKLIFEELMELAEALGIIFHLKNPCTIDNLKVKDFEIYQSIYAKQDLVEIADALGDLNYVVTGTAVAMGIDIERIDEEIHKSNMSKFIDGHRRDDGKWIKGPSYFPPDLKTVLDTQEAINVGEEYK